MPPCRKIANSREQQQSSASRTRQKSLSYVSAVGTATSALFWSQITVITYAPIRIVGPARFDPGTTQTPGSERLAAVALQLGIESLMWGGLFEVGPQARTGIHHLGEQQRIASVLSGVCEVRWEARGESAARAAAGDFIHVPAFLPHMEINLSDSEPFRWVVVRSTPTPIVVNLPDNCWD
jgi:uncharacterized RmlC-like cupin family protein